MFHGSMVALVTPMQANGVIDVESLRHLVEWHISEGTDAIVVLGSTGEASTINSAERKLIIQQAIEQANGRVPIIAGSGSNSTALAIHMTKEAMEAGADACLLVTPYYNKPTQEGLYLHFKAVAEAVPIPQILYNVPSRTVCDLLPETIARLADLSNIVGIKEATGDMDRLRTILSLVGNSIDLYSGDDATSLDFMLTGGRGVISVTANVAPALMHDMCMYALKKDSIKAKECNDQLEALNHDLFIETNPIPVKWALHTMGKIPLGIRLPLTPFSEQYRPKLLETLAKIRIEIPD